MTAKGLLRVLVCGLVLIPVTSASSVCAQNENDPEAKTSSEKEKAALHDAAENLKAKLGTKSDRLSKAAKPFLTAAENPTDISELKRTTDDLQTTLDDLSKDANFDSIQRVPATKRAIAASLAYQEAVKKAPPPPPAKSPSTTDLPLASNWTALILPVAAAVAAAGLIVLAIFGILRMRRGYWARFDHHVNGIVKAHTKELMQRQDELAKQFVALGNQHRSGSARLESIEGELQALGRRARAMSDGRGYQGDSGRNSDNDSSRPQPPPVEPEFPASVNEYLNKMKRNSTVVKPDFQNGILVSDLDGRGELVLIRDTGLADGAQPLFLVPRVGQFQTKQEFHSYYERYYDCHRPSAGDVWIIDPAVVSTVPGGWELREKGVLEVR